ncbi:hypothetical protein SUGI_0441640 [Cryptomeria japonica]|uniref:early light-induced protein 1, chloroplastic n=1 Tax=Cryptomeria japonica TaxID=3369 RepID=UPI002408F05C|nr:early light-induced protein 1, chloroplastic [Cryptomeria japonica]GLJ23339.1 hypothetical protein SUGI_0441640 [Cryptomeria japonica]
MALSANAACAAFRSLERHDFNKVSRSIPATRSFPRSKGPQVKCTAEPEKEPSLDAPKPTNPPPFRPKVSTKFSDVFAFSGPAPETINGRLAMVGFVSAVGVELVTGEDLLTQLSQGEGVTWFLFTATVLTAASLIPMFQGVTRESRSQALMSSTAETWNGRLAMLGFVALAVTEYFKGGPLV